MFPRGHPCGVLGGRRAHPARGHGLQHGPGQRLLRHPRPQFADGSGESGFGDAKRLAHRRDFVGRLDAPRRAHGRLSVDEFGIRECIGQQRGESRCDRVGSDPARRFGAVDLLQYIDEGHRIPGQPVQVIVADFFGDSLVVGAVEVDVPGGAHHDAHRTERSRAGYPQLRRAGDVTNIGLPAEHQDVEVVCVHLGQRPFPTSGAQCPGVGRNFSRHKGCRGSR